MLEAVLETAAMVIIQLVLIHRVGVLAADLPEERVELVFVARLFEVVDKTEDRTIISDSQRAMSPLTNQNLKENFLKHITLSPERVA